MKILNFGSMNIDFVYAVDHILQPGETLMAGSRSVHNGGKGLNQSIAVARAGGNVWHAGVAGEDGGRLIRALEENGVHTEHVRREAGPSSHTVIQVDRNGQNCIIVFNGERMKVSEDQIDRVLEAFEPGDLLLMQNELDNSPLIMRKGAQRGLQVAFNPSPINEGLRAYPLECVSWFIMNETEGKALTGRDDPQEILDEMGRLYPNAKVVLTLGSDGAYCRCGGETAFQPAVKTEVVDTTAAGDTFTGYFLTAISEGLPVGQAMALAAKAASIAVSRPGAADSIPLRREMEE